MAIWFGFGLAYQLARGLSDRHPTKAFSNGLWVVHFETQWTNRMYELVPAVHRPAALARRDGLVDVLELRVHRGRTCAALGVHPPHEHLIRFRNAILFSNVLGLIGYIFEPMAPPRLLGVGFANNHTDGVVQLAANPYAAMPSLHACDSLIVGIVLASVVKHWWAKAFWIVWPAWVWFAVMATGNHFWLDCVAGMALALVSMAVVYKWEAIRGFLFGGQEARTA
jgi:hypothetical protein